MFRRILVLAATAALAAGVVAVPASAHTDPTGVSPANGSVVPKPVSTLSISYPERVGVFTLTLTNGTARQVVKVSRKDTRFAIPVRTGKGAWVAAWDTLMPDGDEVTQATTWRVGRLAGKPKPAQLKAGKDGATVTVKVSDVRPGAPAKLTISVAKGQLVESYVTTAGLDVPVGKTGGNVVLVKDSSVSSLVLLPTGNVTLIEVPIR